LPFEALRLLRAFDALKMACHEQLRRSASNGDMDGSRRFVIVPFGALRLLRAFDAQKMACHEQAPQERVEWGSGSLAQIRDRALRRAALAQGIRRAKNGLP
jgi:hypothetical protein